MGKQRNMYFIGRQDNIVYYEWKGGYYMRTKSTLNGKRFWQDPAFAGSRKRAVEFGEASKLASEVYQLLPVELRKRGVQGRLTGWAHRGLMAGASREEVKGELLAACGLSVKVNTATTSHRACTAGVDWLQLSARDQAQAWTVKGWEAKKEKLPLLYVLEAFKRIPSTALRVGVMSG